MTAPLPVQSSYVWDHSLGWCLLLPHQSPLQRLLWGGLGCPVPACDLFPEATHETSFPPIPGTVASAPWKDRECKRKLHLNSIILKITELNKKKSFWNEGEKILSIIHLISYIYAPATICVCLIFCFLTWYFNSSYIVVAMSMLSMETVYRVCDQWVCGPLLLVVMWACQPAADKSEVLTYKELKWNQVLKKNTEKCPPHAVFSCLWSYFTVNSSTPQVLQYQLPVRCSQDLGGLHGT